MVVATEGLNADGLHKVIVRKLGEIRYSFQNALVKLIYDGASVMSGKHQGVSTCLLHSLLQSSAQFGFGICLQCRQM